MKKVFSDKRIMLLYLFVILFLVIGVTYALSSNSMALGLTTAIVRVDEEAYGTTTFDSSELEFIPILDSEVEVNQENVIHIDFKVGGDAENNNDNIIYDIALNDLEVNCNLLSPYIKWKLVKNGEEISNGSLDYKFDTIDENGRLVLTKIQQDLVDYSDDKSVYDDYNFYMWFSDACQSYLETCSNNGLVDQSNLLGQNISGKIEVELYTESKKELVRNPENVLNNSKCGGKYMVTLNLNEGTTTSDTTFAVINGQPFGTLSTPTRTDVVTFDTNGGQDVAFVNNKNTSLETNFLKKDYSMIENGKFKMPKVKRLTDESNIKSISYTFDGWYLDKEFTQPVTSSTNVNVSKNINLYAKWSGDNQIILPETTRVGYDFLGWYNDITLNNKVGNAGDSYTVDGSHSLYAKWDANIYKVKYHNNLNYIYKADSILAKLNGRSFFKKYDGAAFVGYLYNGTYTGPVLVGTTADSVAYYPSHDKTITVVSKGSFEYEGVTYYYSGGDYWMEGNFTDSSGMANRVKYTNMTIAQVALKLLEDNVSTVEQDLFYDIEGNLLSNSYNKTGYTFTGWSTTPLGNKQYDDGQALNSTTEYDAHVLNLYANWTVNSYTATYNNNLFGTNNLTSNGLTISYDPSTSYMTIDGTSVSSGFRFINLTGMTFTANDQYKITLEHISGSYTLTGSGYFVTEVYDSDGTAPATRNNKDIQFPIDNGTNTGILAINSDAASTATQLNVWLWQNTVNGYVFDDYKVKVNITKVETKTGTYEQLLPTITKHTKSYTVTYNGNGGTAGISNNKADYTLDGYYTGENGGGARYYDGSGGRMKFWDTASNMTFYTKWTPTSVPLPSATKTGSNFNGWYTTASGGTSMGGANATFTPQAPITLYASWSTNGYYFDVNPSSHISSFTISGGVNSGSNLTDYYYVNDYGTQFTITNITAKTGYTYTGYTRSGSVTDVSGSTNSTIKVQLGAGAGAIALNSKANTYTVTLDRQGGTTGSTSVTATYNSAMPSATMPSRAYTVTYNANGGSVSETSKTATYSFGGYYTSTGGGGTQYYTSAGASARAWNLTSATTLYAKWTSASVTLPTPTRSGYTFLGWYTATSGGTKIGNGGATYTPTSTLTIYAQWRANNYQISAGSATYADTLANAISWANAGATITLLKDVTDSSTSTATFNKNLTFAFGAYDLTRAAMVKIASGATVTFTGTGGLVSTSNITLDVAGTFTLNGPNIYNAAGTADSTSYEAIRIETTSGAVKLNTGKVYSRWGRGVRILDEDTNRKILYIGNTSGTYSQTTIQLFAQKGAVVCDGTPKQTMYFNNGRIYSADMEWVTTNMNESIGRGCGFNAYYNAPKKTYNPPAISVGSYSYDPPDDSAYKLWLTKNNDTTADCAK